MLLIGLVAMVAQIVAFAYFLYSSYSSKLEKEFLSLDNNAGICESVTLSETNVFYVDKYGSWDQAASYKSQESLFVVRFTGYRGDESSWAADMNVLYSVINIEMNYLRSISDLPTKILHLNSWRRTIAATRAGSFQVWFNADASDMFNMPNSQLASWMGHWSSDCQTSDAWNLNEGVLSLIFDEVYDEASAEVTYVCDTFDITDVGFDILV